MNNSLTDELLGQGTFGEVYVCVRRSDGKKFAAKLIKALGLMNGRDQQKFFLEAQILHKLNHPCIVKFHGINFHSFKDPNLFQPTILTEYIPRGSLQKILFQEQEGHVDPKYDSTTKYIILIGIAETVRYLHANRVIHRDLKPLNILVDDQFQPYVCDFGVSRCFTKDISNKIQIALTGCVGSP